jgi:hypothetical protein
MTIPRWIVLKIRNFSNKHCKQNQNTHFMYSIYITKCDVIQNFSFSTRDEQFHILFNVTSVTTTNYTTLLTHICGRSPDHRQGPQYSHHSLLPLHTASYPPAWSIVYAWFSLDFACVGEHHIETLRLSPSCLDNMSDLLVMFLVRCTHISI